MLGTREIIIFAVVIIGNILFWGGLVFFAVKLANGTLGKRKSCPFCAEKIKKGAIVCRYCKKDIE